MNGFRKILLRLRGFLLGCAVVLFIGFLAHSSVTINTQPGKNIGISWNSQTNAQYEIDWASSLTGSLTNWQLMQTLVATNTNTLIIDSGASNRPPPSDSTSRFYRLAPINPTPIVSDILTNTLWNS